MLEVTETLKNKYKDGKSHKVNYLLEIYNDKDMTDLHSTYTNNEIEQESVEITEALYEGNNMQIGALTTSELQVSLSITTETTSWMKGKYLKATQYLDDNTDGIQMGCYIITDVTRRNNHSMLVDVVAYDYSVLLDTSAKEYIFRYYDPSVTIGEALYNALDMIGFPYEEQEIDGADGYVESQKGAMPEIVTYRMWVAYCGQLLGGWYRVNRKGKLQFYPAKSPDTSTDEEISFFIQQDYSEFDFSPITNISYTFSYGNYYTTTGTANTTGTNTLDISENWLPSATFNLENRTAKLNTLLENMLNKVGLISFTPAKIQIPARPYIEVGDYVTFYDTKGRKKSLLVASRTISGIHAQRDTFICQTGDGTAKDYASVSAQVNSVQASTAKNAGNTAISTDNPYYIKNLEFDDTNLSFLVTVERVSGTDTTTNEYTYTVDEAGNVTEILNVTTGKTMTVSGDVGGSETYQMTAEETLKILEAET